MSYEISLWKWIAVYYGYKIFMKKPIFIHLNYFCGLRIQHANEQ